MASRRSSTTTLVCTWKVVWNPDGVCGAIIDTDCGTHYATPTNTQPSAVRFGWRYCHHCGGRINEVLTRNVLEKYPDGSAPLYKLTLPGVPVPDPGNSLP